MNGRKQEPTGDILRHARTQTVTTVFLRISPKYKQS